MKKKVTIIILNWNGWEDTVECLESLLQINYYNYNIIVVDNYSKDDSITKIKEYCANKLEIKYDFSKHNPYNKPINVFEYTKEEFETLNIDFDVLSKLKSSNSIVLLKNDKNYGFAEGNNIGIRFALNILNPDYILLLNNDTVVDERFLDELIRIAEINPQIAAVGPKTFYYDYNGKKDVICFEGGKINFFKGEVSHLSKSKTIETPQEVDYIEGSCFLIKKEVIEKVGLLSSEYFLYWEETDWCARIKKESYTLMNVPTAKIWHKVDREPNNNNIYYMARNKFLFMKKNSNKIQMLSFLIYFLLFKLWFKLFSYTFYYKQPKMATCFFKGTKEGLKFLLTY